MVSMSICQKITVPRLYAHTVEGTSDGSEKDPQAEGEDQDDQLIRNIGGILHQQGTGKCQSDHLYPIHCIIGMGCMIDMLYN